MTLEGKRIAILVEDGFEDDELTEPLYALRGVGADVVLVGGDAEREYEGKRGEARVTSDISARDADVADFDALVVPGGHAPDGMRMHEPMVEMVRMAVEQGKVLAAVCHGPQLLISAGVVEGRRMTSWPSIAVDLRNAGADWTDSEVVVDGRLITSRKPSDLPAFNRAIEEALGS